MADSPVQQHACEAGDRVRDPLQPDSPERDVRLCHAAKSVVPNSAFGYNGSYFSYSQNLTKAKAFASSSRLSKRLLTDADHHSGFSDQANVSDHSAGRSGPDRDHHQHPERGQLHLLTPLYRGKMPDVHNEALTRRSTTSSTSRTASSTAKGSPTSTVWTMRR